MSSAYHHNHYVPVWYQKRFIPIDAATNELFYLDLKPEVYIDSRGGRHTRGRPWRWGPNHCFAQNDLYTTNLGSVPSTEIEQAFFGPIDVDGKKGVELLAGSDHRAIIQNQGTFKDMMGYMGAQKLRTPKGLGWLRANFGTSSKEEILAAMVQYRNLHSANWLECVWQIADASGSDTKFILSDHPVTVYNRRCGPRSEWCRGYNDPDVWLQASHTIFPLSSEKILILTNRSWARNPYQIENAKRPNPNPYRPAVMALLDIQMDRQLSETEVRQTNFIIKNRAHRYIAAGKEEWLYPERHVSKSDWHDYGDGYLFMPDPRALAAGGEIVMGFADGSTAAFDAYGRTPGQPDYRKESDEGLEFAALARFQGEFARRYGRKRRGRSGSFDGVLGTESDSEEFHQFHLDQEKPNKWKMTGATKGS